VANPEHVELVLSGTEELAKWQELNPGVVLDLSDANLTRAELYGADLQRASMGRAHLHGASLIKTQLAASDLRSADLSDSALMGTEFFGTRLDDADLRGADLSLASLKGTVLLGATLLGARLFLTTFAFVDLRGVKGLEAVHHLLSSTIGIDTLYASQGEIPEVFLRGAGVPDDFIEFAKTLVGKPFDFYSCFISHSSVDHEFAERLHADLQAKSVRCWYAPEDLKIGDRFSTRIDEAIRIHDKLLLILSENSVRSAWVETEVETAFERERREKRTVLFPIRIDDAVMQTDAACAADIRRTRHIGDFRNWKDHDSYQKAFERLLRDLKSDAQPVRTD
jgi:hypothetical protein